MINLSVTSLIELTINGILIFWIITATIKSLKKVAPVSDIKHLDLMRGIWKLEIALGLALGGLTVLGVFTAIYFSLSLGILVSLITLGVFILTYQATRDLERIPTIASYAEKVKAWTEKRK